MCCEVRSPMSSLDRYLLDHLHSDSLVTVCSRRHDSEEQLVSNGAMHHLCISVNQPIVPATQPSPSWKIHHVSHTDHRHPQHITTSTPSPDQRTPHPNPHIPYLKKHDTFHLIIGMKFTIVALPPLRASTTFVGGGLDCRGAG